MRLFKKFPSDFMTMLKSTTFLALSLFWIAQSGMAASDTLTLQNKDTIKGQVTAIDQGIVHLLSPLSTESLHFKSEQMSSIIFENETADVTAQHAGLVQLHNGDRFSGDLRELTENSITFDTWYAGSLNIPRRDIASLYLGVNPQELLYQGPNGLAGWEEINGWDFEENELISTGIGLISRKVGLPDQYIVTITLGSQNNPNCVIHIGNENANPRESSDEYMITFNASGLDLKRHAPDEKRKYLAIENLQAPPAQMQNNEAVIELRVNRRTREILLYLNEEKIGRYLDPLKDTPKGPYISIESRSSERKGNIIKNVQIRKWDAVSERLQKESAPKDKSLDALTTNEGERYSGQVLSFDPANNTFQVQSPLAEQPITIPANKTAVLHFKKEKTETGDNVNAQTAQKPLFKLLLTSGGELTLDSLHFENATMEASNPILGALKLDRKILQQITKQAPASVPAEPAVAAPSNLDTQPR